MKTKVLNRAFCTGSGRRHCVSVTLYTTVLWRADIQQSSTSVLSSREQRHERLTWFLTGAECDQVAYLLYYSGIQRSMGNPVEYGCEREGQRPLPLPCFARKNKPVLPLSQGTLSASGREHQVDGLGARRVTNTLPNTAMHLVQIVRTVDTFS